MIKNSLYLFLGRISNAIFLLLLTLTVSRMLGPSLFGIYSFLTTVILTGTHIASFGLDTLMVRETTKNPSEGKIYLSNILALKMFTSIATILIVSLIFIPFPLDTHTRYLLFVLSFSLLFNALSQTLWHYGDSFEKFIFHSILWAGTNFIKAITGISLLFIFKNISSLVWGLVLAEALSLVLSYLLIKNRFGNFTISFNFHICLDLITRSTPLAIGAILSAVYFRLDIVMLKLLKSDEVVGWYSAAYKLIEVFTIIPSSIVLVFFPSLVKNYHFNKTQFIKEINKPLITLFIMGISLATFIFIFSKKITLIIYGNSFLPSYNALQILSWALLFIFLNYLLSYILISAGKEKVITFNLLIVTSLNIGLNLMLIPKYGHTGAGFATLISEILLMVLYGFAVKQVISITRTSQQ